MIWKAVMVGLCAAACLAQDPVLRGKAELVLAPVAVTDNSGAMFAT
jgi:hypothetical protein